MIAKKKDFTQIPYIVKNAHKWIVNNVKEVTQTTAHNVLKKNF